MTITDEKMVNQAPAKKEKNSDRNKFFDPIHAYFFSVITRNLVLPSSTLFLLLRRLNPDSFLPYRRLTDILLPIDNFNRRAGDGGGGFGKVYKAQLLLSGALTTVALKRLDPKFGQGNPEFWKEIVTLSLYKHQHIVSLLGFCDEKGEKILVYEYASRGSLDAYLDSDDLNWIHRLKICIGAAHGLAYLHDPGDTQQRVLHRDVKSSNILLDENWNARIADLGLCKFGPANQQYTFLVSNTVGTIGYCDPLYVESGLLTKESDVYSFGVVLFEVLCGRLSIGNIKDKRRPLTGLVRQYYERNNIGELVHANLKDEITSRSLEEFTAIAYPCLSIDLKKRPKMAKVVISLERALQYQVEVSESKEFVDMVENMRMMDLEHKVNTGNVGLPSLDSLEISSMQIIRNEDLEELEELSSSTFATLYHGTWRGTHVAIKRYKKSCFAGRSSEQETLTTEFWREAVIFSNLHHPNVITFYGVVQDGPNGTLATVIEFMVDGSLRGVLLRKDKHLDRRKKLLIAMNIAFGMEYLHSKNIVHFDLKCDNVLVNMNDPSRPTCKVSGFGLSRIKRNTLVTGVARGPLPWMAPELFNSSSDKVSEKVDVYSFGIVLWEILTGEEPYANMHISAIIEGIVNNMRPPIPRDCDPEWRRLMEQCWDPDPLVRPSFAEITLKLRVMM